MVSRLDDYEDETPEYKSDYEKLDEKIKAINEHVHVVNADLVTIYHCCIKRHAVLLVCAAAGMLILGVSFGIVISTLARSVEKLQQKVEALEKLK